MIIDDCLIYFLSLRVKMVFGSRDFFKNFSIAQGDPSGIERGLN